MGFGQTMITVAFLVLLTLAVVNANKMIVDKETTYYEAMATEQGSILAGNLMNEIVSKKFDEVVDTTSSYYRPTTDFTSTGNFGFYDDAGTWNEFIGVYYNSGNWTYPYDWKTSTPYSSMQYFDDVDDYNGYTRNVTETTATLPGFTLTVNVNYVNPTDPNTTSILQTYLKKITVTVTNSKYLRHSLVFSTTKAYTF